MADSVDTLVLESTPRRYIARFTNISDATGESGVVKVDKSALVDFAGLEPYRLIVDYIKWSIAGFASVRLYFDHTTDDELAVLSGNGERDYSCEGGLRDPVSAGGTGDILLTTNSAVAGAVYDIELNCRLEAAK